MKSEIAAVLAAASAFCLYATSYTWIGGTEGAWNDAANWVQDGTSVHAVPNNWQDTATLACEDGDITITCSGWLEPALVFATNVTFHVASGTATVKGAHSGTGNITKTGAGELVFNSSSSRSGWTFIDEGTLSIKAERGLGQDGGCVVGDGEHDAYLNLTSDRDSQWGGKIFGPQNTNGKGSLVIRNKGVLIYDNQNTYKTTVQLSGLTIDEGGLARMGSHGVTAYGSLLFDIAGDISFISNTFDGNGQFQLGSSELKIHGTRSRTFFLPVNLTVQRDWVNGPLWTRLNAVGGNGLEVDLHVSAPITSASNYGYRDGIDCIGSGTIKLTGSSTYGGIYNNEAGATRVLKGRLLIDNTEGSGTGYSKVDVSAGAILGGVGTIGGLTENKTYGGGTASASTPCVVVNGTEGNPGVLAPGSYEDTTNARIYGTLTVGGEESPSSVTMNKNTKLAFEAGKGGATGLKVYGPLTLGSDVVLDVNVRDDAKTGDYVLVSATGGITGEYTLTGNAGAAKVVRSENQILLKIRKGLIITFR